MWLGLIAFLVLVVAIVGSIASGGIFTIVLLPIGIIAVLGAIVARGMGQRAETATSRRPQTPEASAERRAREESPLPHSAAGDTVNHQPATPDQQVEARLRGQ